jgi:hypothetical protein
MSSAGKSEVLLDIKDVAGLLVFSSSEKYSTSIFGELLR